MDADLSAKLEAILFFKAQSLSLGELARLCGAPLSDVRAALQELSQDLTGRGVALLLTGEEAELRVSGSWAPFIARMRTEELSRDLGKAGAETLALVLYAAPITRARIDYIRGVDSTFTLRALAIRGLIARDVNPQDERSYLYRPTTKLLAHLGVTAVTELPEYEKARAELVAYERAQKENEEKS